MYQFFRYRGDLCQLFSLKKKTFSKSLSFRFRCRPSSVHFMSSSTLWKRRDKEKNNFDHRRCECCQQHNGQMRIDVICFMQMTSMRNLRLWGFIPGYSRSLPKSTVSYIHWRGVPQGPGRGRRPRPGSLRYTSTVNVRKLFSHAPRMAQITAAVTAAAAAAVVSFRYFPPGREIPGLNFPARRLPRKYLQIHPGRWPSFCMQIVTWHGRTRESPPG